MRYDTFNFVYYLFHKERTKEIEEFINTGFICDYDDNYTEYAIINNIYKDEDNDYIIKYSSILKFKDKVASGLYEFIDTIEGIKFKFFPNQYFKVTSIDELYNNCPEFPKNM